MSDKPLSWEAAVLWLRNQPGQQELVHACFYDDPLPAAAARYAASTEWQAVRSLLPSSFGRALDIGAGRGIAAYALARDGWDVVALEPDPSTVVGAAAIRALASETGLDIEVIERQGEDLPFADASFDLVHCRQVLHHASHLNTLCREIGRVLKPGGMLLATREHVISRHEDLPQFLSGHPLHKLYGGEHAYLLHEYTAAIRQGRMSLVQVLNPFQSDINLYPETRMQLKQRLSNKLHLPVCFVPDFALGWIGKFSNNPGRLYTFIGRKN